MRSVCCLAWLVLLLLLVRQVFHLKWWQSFIFVISIFSFLLLDPEGIQSSTAESEARVRDGQEKVDPFRFVVLFFLNFSLNFCQLHLVTLDLISFSFCLFVSLRESTTIWLLLVFCLFYRSAWLRSKQSDCDFQHNFWTADSPTICQQFKIGSSTMAGHELLFGPLSLPSTGADCRRD